jgi:hypothetical protein
MPYVLIAIGIILAWLDYLGTDSIQAAGSLANQEFFTGTPPFWKWAGAMIVIAAIGYIPDMAPVATAMLTLVLVVMILSNRGGFVQLIQKA